MLLSRWRYYISSIPTLLFGIKNWPVVWKGLSARQPFILKLRNGLQFHVRTLMDIWIIKETCLDHDYETHGVPLQNGWTVMDIGAGLGDFTVYAAKKLPDSVIHAYEPFPESFRLLEENIALNGAKNVLACACAIGANSHPLVLSTATGIPVMHSTASETSHHDDTVQVMGVTLDEVLRSIERCDFLKMDCEGAEYEILFHASAPTLHKIRHLCMEYHEGITKYTHQDLVKFLEKHGFKVKITPNPAHQEIGFLYATRQG